LLLEDDEPAKEGIGKGQESSEVKAELDEEEDEEEEEKEGDGCERWQCREMIDDDGLDI
jgi:hypothetical protein